MTKYEVKEFIDYVLDFYGQRGIYEMSPPATQEEIEVALQERKKHQTPPFDGDSIDRELVRDVILAKRGETELEHAIVLNWVKVARKYRCLQCKTDLGGFCGKGYGDFCSVECRAINMGVDPSKARREHDALMLKAKRKAGVK